MKLRVGIFHSLAYGDQIYRGGDEFEVPDDAAANWLRTGMVVPADNDWRGAFSGEQPAPVAPMVQPAKRPEPLPAAKAGEYVPHDPCEPNGPVRAVCSVSGCPCQVSKAGECAECRRVHNRHRTRKREHKAYQRKPWKRTRREYLRAHPLCECEDCALIAEPLRPSASVVDHIDGLGALGPRAHDWSNLRALSKRCHDRRTMRDQVNGADN
ncbi:HNH endonuclease [Streptomyces sp. CA-106131]|uniref:HNH endonuclease n=1 Tax=Streptomyces sp. CA-106131 TaxID=3240045 RepID=UPI003D8EBF43